MTTKTPTSTDNKTIKFIMFFHLICPVLCDWFYKFKIAMLKHVIFKIWDVYAIAQIVLNIIFWY
jgi:hypothetical protein